ncbi:MAG TPA: PAS domain S-box protein, partial [Pyrinomonadaceae bacterium]
MPYKPLVEEIRDYAIFHLNLEGRILSWNQGARLIFGYGKDEIVGQDFIILFTPEDRAENIHERELEKAAETGRAEDTRWHLRKDASRFFAQGVTTALRDDDGKLIGFAKIARDDTPRRQMEEALLESEEKYRIVAEAATDAIISIDEQSTILFVNRAATRIFGYEIAQMINQPLTMLMPEYLRHLHRAGQQRYLETGKKHLNWEHIEVPALHRDGHEFPLELSFGEFSKNDKHIFIGIARDVTRRKRAEEIIRRTQARLESVLEAGLAGTFFWNIPNDRVITDENMMRYFSLSETALTEGVPLAEVLPAIHEADFPHVSEALTEAVERSGIYQIEYRVNHSDGKVRWLSARGAVERDEAGNARELTGFAVDITGIKEAEEAVRKSEEQLRTLADTIPQLAWMAEPDGFIFWYNRRWYEYTGTTPEQMEGWGWQTVHRAEMLPRILDLWKHSIETGEPFEMEFPLLGASGEFRWFLTRVNPLLDAQGNITRWFGTNTDVHEKRIAQRNS